MHFHHRLPGLYRRTIVAAILAEPRTTVRLLVIPAMRAAAEAAREAIPTGRERTEIVLGDITRPNWDSTRQHTRGWPPKSTRSITWPRSMTWRRRSRSRGWSTSRARSTFSISASRSPHLRKLVYFSTAYVSGTRTGRVLEDELEETTSWKNYYELTKWEAEVAVRERWKRIPTVIIRPGVVTGDSRTGEINKYDGPYFVIRAHGRHGTKGAAALEPVLLVRWA